MGTHRLRCPVKSEVSAGVTNQMPAPVAPTVALVLAGRMGTDWSYSNGLMGPGSSMKTPYMVSPFAQTRHFAHLMQQMTNFRGEDGKGREDRESELSLTQKRGAINRRISRLSLRPVG
jgi:hypothetical protein